jgi:hypothetical protein
VYVTPQYFLFIFIYLFINHSNISNMSIALHSFVPANFGTGLIMSLLTCKI